MRLVKILLLIGCLIGVNILLPKTLEDNHWVTIFFGYIAFTSVFIIYSEFISYRRSRMGGDNQK